jgi:hypothetical protein
MYGAKLIVISDGRPNDLFYINYCSPMTLSDRLDLFFGPESWCDLWSSEYGGVPIMLGIPVGKRRVEFLFINHAVGSALGQVRKKYWRKMQIASVMYGVKKLRPGLVGTRGRLALGT